MAKQASPHVRVHTSDITVLLDIFLDRLSHMIPILLLETPCPFVRPSVRHVFYAHLSLLYFSKLANSISP